MLHGCQPPSSSSPDLEAEASGADVLPSAAPSVTRFITCVEEGSFASTDQYSSEKA